MDQTINPAVYFSNFGACSEQYAFQETLTRGIGVSGQISFVAGAILYIVECLVASLATTHLLLAAYPPCSSCDNLNNIFMSPAIAKCPLEYTITGLHYYSGGGCA